MVSWTVGLFYPVEKKDDIPEIKKDLNAFLKEQGDNADAGAFYETDGSWFVYVDGEDYGGEIKTLTAILDYIAEKYPDSVSVGHWDDDKVGEEAFYIMNDGTVNEFVTWDNIDDISEEANELLEKGNTGKYAILYMLSTPSYELGQFKYVRGLEDLDCWEKLENEEIYPENIADLVRVFWGLKRQ